MDIASISLLLISAVSCALIGIFIVSANLSMIVEVISHSVLLGIVLVYLVSKKINPAYIMFGAILSAFIVSVFVHEISKIKFISKDLAMGVVLPLLFSIAIVIISGPLRNTRISKQMVLAGNLAVAVYAHLINGVFPTAILINGGVLLLNIIFISLFYKELKLTSFDRNFAKTINMHPNVLFYLLIINVSLTAVTSFESVGSILVSALMVIPATIALQYTNNFRKLIFITVIVSVVCGFVGYEIADFGNLSYSGTISTILLLGLVGTIVFHPKNGVVFKIVKRRERLKEYKCVALLICISHDKDKSITNVATSLNWDEGYTSKQYLYATNRKYLTQNNIDANSSEGCGEGYVITDKGYAFIKAFFEK